MADDAVRYFPAERLREFSARTFGHFGVPPADAARAADVLAASDLRGVDSHGVARLHTYFDMLTLGRINPRPNVRVVRELPATAAVAVPPPMRSATTTLAAPLATSRIATSRPAVTPEARNTFAAPTFPLPTRRRSLAPQRRASSQANGVEPIP